MSAFESTPAVCVPLSTTNVFSITNSTWTDNGTTELAMQYNDANNNPLLIVNLKCDSTAATPIISNYSYDGTTYTTTFTGAQACPLFTISALWEFLY